MKQYEPLLVEHNIMARSATAPSPDEIELFSMTPEQEDEVDELFDFFTRPKQECPLNVPTCVQESDVCLTLENTASEHSIVSEKRSEESDDVILVQLDEVVTKSQEKGRKTNLTYTGTVEDRSGRVVHLVAESSEALIRLIAVQLVLFGLFSGKRLEVLSDDFFVLAGRFGRPPFSEIIIFGKKSHSGVPGRLMQSHFGNAYHF